MTGRFVLTSFLLLCCSTASAVEQLSSSVLLRQCGVYARDTVENEAVSCRAWVHGFIGGAFATRVALAETAAGKESFTDRAARTRLGSKRPQYGQNLQAGYCLPTSTTLDEIIAGLNAYASALEEVPEQANQLMVLFLRSRYACPTSRR